MTSARESSVCDYAVADYAICDMGYTPSTAVVAPAITVYDASMNALGIIDNYETFKWERNWYSPDTWDMEINRYITNADQLVISGFIRYTREGMERIGLVEKFEKVLDEDGKGGETWKVSGRGVEAVVGHRIAMNLTDSGTGYDTSSNHPTETTLRYYVNKNLINPTDTARKISGISLAAVDLGRGADASYNARFQNLLQIHEELCKLSGLSYGLEWSGSGRNFTYTIYAGTDLSDNVVLSPAFDNIKNMEYLYSILEMKNILYVTGSGTGASRLTQEVYSGTAEPISWARRETQLDASDLTTADQLTDRGESALVDYSEEEGLEVEYLRSNSFIYGQDFDLGDTVTVVFPDVVTMVARIVRVTESFSPDEGETVTLGFGKDYPDLVSIVRRHRRMFDAGMRK